MADTESLPRPILEHVAGQIGERLGSKALKAEREGVVLQLGATLSVWSLGLDATTHVDEDIKTLAHATGTWHHQVLYGSAAEESAKSVPQGPRAEDWKVVEVVTSPIPAGIQSAIDWLAKNEHADEVVRLLIIPSYYIHALWLFGEQTTSKIILADRPSQYEALRYERLYTSQEFLTVLSHLPHASGIPSLAAGRR